MKGSGLSRRDFLASSTAAGTLGLASEGNAEKVAAPSGAGTGADLAWLDRHAPSAHEGQSWGHPWPRGTRYSKAGYRLAVAGGEIAAVQTWPLAWWPDGSIKWTGHAIP